MNNELYVKPITYDELYEKIKQFIKKEEEWEIIEKA